MSRRTSAIALLALGALAALAGLLVLIGGGERSMDGIEAEAADWFGRDVHCEVAYEIPEDLGEGQALVCGGREFILRDDGTLYGPDGAAIP